MTGRESKNKGKRAEYKLRDELRELGYTSERVPCSGSLKDQPGDVWFTKDGIKRVAEVKSRAKGFETQYALIGKEERIGVFLSNGFLCLLSYDLELVIKGDNLPSFLEASPRLSGKLLTMFKWLGKSNILSVKQNNKRFIHIRYI